MRICETCKFWEAAKDHGGERRLMNGACRRYPPELGYGWPITHADGWCGEWADKPEPVCLKDTVNLEEITIGPGTFTAADAAAFAMGTRVAEAAGGQPAEGDQGPEGEPGIPGDGVPEDDRDRAGREDIPRCGN